ncbi:hypothetical protein ABZS61_23530 [Streptomyces sp. NPDC005566]|uniref:hypothetical protein n=1 Tax=Streptomyces sp. NPDC005566 TaxID=3156886 RepID=UPI0033AF7E99
MSADDGRWHVTHPSGGLALWVRLTTALAGTVVERAGRNGAALTSAPRFAADAALGACPAPHPATYSTKIAAPFSTTPAETEHSDSSRATPSARTSAAGRTRRLRRATPTHSHLCEAIRARRMGG